MSHNRLALSCDRSGCIVDVVRDDIGVLPADPIGLPLAQFVSAGSTHKLFELLTELQEDGAVFGRELLIQREGEDVHIHVAGAQRGDTIFLIGSDDWQDVTRFNDELMRINNEQLTQLRTMIRGEARQRPGPQADVLERMSEVGNELAGAHRRLAKQERDLEHAIDAQNLLVGMVVHDMRSPLTAIGGFAELMLGDDNLVDDQRELLRHIEQMCTSMGALIRNTLEWTRLEAAKLRLEPVALDLNKLVESALSVQRIVARRNGVELRFTPNPDLPRVAVDPLRLRQVIDNLVGNAIDASPAATHVTLELTANADQVELRVHDSGPGIDEEQRKSLFEPYAGSKSEDGQHFGLGLAIVKRLVELHGGSVDALDDPEGGSDMRVRLPLHG